MLIKRKHSIINIPISPEAKFNTIIYLIKDLDQAEYNRVRDGMDLIYKGYQKICKSNTKVKKDFSEIDKAEELLEVEE